MHDVVIRNRLLECIFYAWWKYCLPWPGKSLIIPFQF